MTDKEIPFAKFGGSSLVKTYPDLERIISREAARLQGVLERLETVGIAETTEAVLRLGRSMGEKIETTQGRAGSAGL